MPEPSVEESTQEWSGRPTVAMIADLTWDQITADGVITVGQVEDMLRAKGLDPNALDYLYE